MHCLSSWRRDVVWMRVVVALGSVIWYVEGRGRRHSCNIMVLRGIIVVLCDVKCMVVRYCAASMWCVMCGV